jgi:hypothetical protein
MCDAVQIEVQQIASHDVCNILVCLGLCNENDLAFHTNVNKANFDRYVFHSLLRKNPRAPASP